MSSALDVNGSFIIANGTLAMNGANNITTAGTVYIQLAANYTKGTGTWTFDGSGSFPYTDSNGASRNLGSVIIDASSSTRTVALSSAIAMDNLTVASDGVFAMGTRNVTVGSTGASGSGDVSIDGSISQSASGTFTILSSSGGVAELSGNGTLSVYNLTLGDGSNSITVDNETTDLNINVKNNLLVMGYTTYLASASDSLTVSGNLTLDTNGIFTGSSASIGVGGNFVNSGAFTAPSATFTIAGDFNNTGTFTHNGGNVKIMGLYSPFTKYDDTGNAACGLAEGSDDGCVMGYGSAGNWNSSYVSDPSVLKDGSTYKMWFTGGNGAADRIGYATSDEGAVWTVYDDGIDAACGQTEANDNGCVFDIGATGAWDSARIISPAVIKDGSTYKMWYSGLGASSYKIGYATSDNGISWTRYDDTGTAACGHTEVNDDGCVFDLGATGAWDDYYILSVTVIKDGTTYKMWYTARDGTTDRIGYATSDNGISWTRYDDTGTAACGQTEENDDGCVFDKGAAGAWDSSHVRNPSVIFSGAGYSMWYEGADPSVTSRIGHATSYDGVNWIRYDNPFVAACGQTEGNDDGCIYIDSNSMKPQVILDGTTLKMWYASANRAYLATSSGKSAAVTTGQAFNNLTFESIEPSEFTFSSASVTVANNFTISSGTVTAPSTTLTVGGNFANSGTFNHNSGTVSLNGGGGTTQQITGATTFNHLSATTSGNRTLQFGESTTFTVAGNLTLTGTSCDALLALQSGASGTPFTLTKNAGGSTSIDYVSVKDSTATNSLTAAHGVSVSGNSGWTITSGCSATTSTSASATGYSFQRKTWYDGTRLWKSYYNGSEIVFYYSTDNGSNWTQNSNATIPVSTNDYSIEADPNNAFIAYTTGSTASTENMLTGTAVAQWKMNESGSGTCSGSLDSCDSISTNHGDWNGGATNTTGKFGNGVTLDGDGDYISVADPGSDSVFDFSDGDSITISAWINPTNLPPADNYDTVVSKNNSSNGQGNYYLQYDDGGHLVFYYNPNAGGYYSFTTTLAPVTTGSWQHIAVKYTYGTASSIKIYHNGTPYAGAWDPSDPGSVMVFESNDPVVIGGDNGGTELVDGKVDDVRIYNVALSDSDIATIGQPGYDIETRSVSSYPGTGFSWSSPTIVYNGSSATNYYQYSTITKDSNNKIWIESTQTSDTTYITKAIQSSSSNSVTSWNTAVTLNSSANSNQYGVIVPRVSGSVYTVFNDGTAIKGCVYDATTDNRWENTAGSTCVDGANQDSIGTGVTGMSNTLSTVADSSGYVHLLYIDSANKVQYKERTTSWQTAVELDGNAGNAYPTISLNTSNNDLYAVWIRSDHIYYKKGATPYASGNWDVSATDWKSTGTNTYVTSNYSGAGVVFAEWTTGTGSPYSVNWDSIIAVPENILALILLAPFIPKLKKRKIFSKVVSTMRKVMRM